MGITERREREKQEVRQRILDAARELFVKDGYEAVTMRKVADAIEYSPTALYLHFKDKESLMRELCHGDFLSLARAFQRIARVRPGQRAAMIAPHLGRVRAGEPRLRSQRQQHAGDRRVHRWLKPQAGEIGRAHV